jgi:hypothetical protein
VVKRRVRLARSALEEEEAWDANWLLTVRTGAAYVGNEPSSRGDLSPLGKAMMIYTINHTESISWDVMKEGTEDGGQLES